MADLTSALPAVELGLQMLSAPLTRYQIQAAAAMNELTPDGAYRWSTVCILWPRQTGKTTLIMLLALSRAQALRDYRAAYAAQTGHITSQRFKEWNDQVRAMRAAGWRTRDSDGTERITCLSTGSYLRAFPPIPGRLRSNALDMVVVDEAQEHDDDRIGARLDDDIVPVMSTRLRSQWIIAGTAGDATATYWRRHYSAAAAGAAGTLLLEIGTPPADVDIDDPAVWAQWHPGVQAGRTTIAKLSLARETLGPDRFAREYFNRWTEAVADSVFPAGSWRGCLAPGSGIDGQPRFALEVAPDRAVAVVVAAGPSTHAADAFHVELVAAGSLDAVAATCAQLAARWRTPIVVDPMSAAVTHLDQLRRARVPVTQSTAADMVTAAGLLFDRVSARTLTHLDQPILTTAAAAARKRTLGSRWAFDRYAPEGHVINAAALALLDAQRHTGRVSAAPQVLAV